MIKRFLKSSVIFFVILAVSFSNVPFYALSGLIDSYERSSGIVDKIALLERGHGNDIVDNFSTLRNISEKLKIHEVRAAVSIRNVGAYVNGTANLTPVIPATAAAGDMMLLAYGTKPYNDAPTIDQGWLSIGSATDGTVAAGIDLGSMQTRIYYKIHTGSEVNPTITNGTNNVSGAVIIVFQKAANETWDTPVGAGGGDATAGTGFSVTASANPGITVGDMLVGYAAIRSDAGTQSTIGITATGLTVGAFTESPATDLVTTAGGDMAMSGGYRSVTAGTASAAPVYASTLAASHTGSAFIVRLRVTPAVTTISNFVGGEPGNSTIAPNASGMVDSFGFATNAGTDTVTAATVGLAAGMGQYIQTVAITNDGDTVTYCSAAPSGDTASLSSCTVPVTTTNTQFKIKLTAKTHAAMPAPAGGSYGVTATVTGWTGTNTTHAGTDSGSSTLTIDNASPAGTTGAGATSAENAQSTVSWTNPGDGDFQQVYIYCKTSSMLSGEAPTEGTDPAVDATACDATARMKYKGTASPQTFTGLTNGTTYYFRIYGRDTNGNFTAYSATQEVTGTPSAPSNTLTISASAGSKVTNVDSGATSQFVHNTSCTTDGTCSAFKMAASGGAVNVTSITVTESSASLNADAELSNATLIYDTDANYSNGTAGTFGTDATFTSQAVTFTNAGLNIPNGSTYYFYIRTDFVNGVNNPTGGATVNFQIANTTDVVSDGTESGTATLAGTTTVLPNVTDVTDSALVDGGRNGETFTITGAGFGTACGSLSVVVGGLTLTCNSAATTTISATIPATQTTTYGGASSMLVTVGGTADDASQTYYVYPSVNLVSTPLVSNAARELDNITLTNSTANASRFGATQGTVTFSGGFGSVGATVVSWGDTSIEVTVPSAIVDTVYLGDITVTRNSDSKTDTAYGSNGFRVLPRITSLVPSSGIVDASVTVNGDHLCQSGTCPGSFSAANKVTFNSGVVATSFTSWSDTVIETAVPTGAITGDVVVTSNTTYTSNALTFTVNANTTTLATGSDPAVNTIAPGASATDVDLFTLQTNGGTESVTSVTVNLSTHLGIGLLAITDNANTVLGSTASPVTGSNVISVAGMSAGTGVTTFKVRATPLSHAGMPAPAGASYSITAPVTAWAGSNTHAGSDTNTNALTIDNTSPAGTTGATPTAGDAQVQLSWSNPGDSDFQKVIIYCKTSSITETPTEGSDPSVDATACDATARVKYSGSVSPQTITGLSNGTLYYFRIYARDTNGNFTAIASTQQVSATPTLTQTLTVGTVGTQAVNLNSGSTAQHIGGAGTAAFTLQINTGSSNVTSVKVSDTGTVAMANLANPKLYYENAVNAASCAYGGAESFVSGAAPVGETVTFTLPSVAVGLTANVTCLYFVSDVTSSAVGGQTIELEITNPSTDVAVSSGVNDDTVAKEITGTTTVLPNVTDATDSALGDGGRNGETFTITGAGFGTACGSISVQVEGTTLTCNSANNTTISATIPSTQITTYGGTGASGMLVTVGGTADDARQTYYVYPSVNLVSTPLVSNAARELDNITLTNSTANASRFGATQGTVTFSGGFGSVSGSVVSWGDTSIEVTVPSAIVDTVYLGDITVTRNSDSKTDTAYGSNGFRVLPKITSLVNSSDSIGQPITVNGNHFCQSGSCPGAFSSANKVTFNVGVEAAVFTSWSDTVIVTEVPTGAVTGNVVVTSDTAYTSNGSTFTLVSTVPNDPTNPKQYKSDGTTEISAGGIASTTSVVLKADLTAGIAINMIIQVEVENVFTGFDGVGIVDGSVGGGGGCTSCTSLANAQVTVSGLTDNIKHWRARAKNTTTSEVSAWVYYGTSSINETDFKIDTTAPVITGTSSGTPGTNSASITWDTSGEISTTRIEYDTAGTFTGGYDCAGTSECTALTDTSPMVNNHTPPPLSNLNSGTTYHYRVRSKDAAGNETIDPATGDYTFLTQTETKPAKTTRFHITGQTGAITNGSPLNQTFSVFMPELATSTKSAFVEIVGVYKTTSSGQTITVQVNGETSKAYALPSASATSHFRILHQVSSVIVETANANTLYVTPETSTTVYVNSADINVNYSYTP